MRSILLLPLVAALPSHRPSLPELSLSQWTDIQQGFTDNLRSLSGWSWSKAQEIAQSLEEELAASEAEDDPTQATIFGQLKADPETYSRLTHVIEFVGGDAKKILDSKDNQITFFAPNNDALKPPEHHGDHGHHDHDHDHDLIELMNNPSLASISTILTRQPSYLIAHEDDDDKDKKKKKEIFRKIAGKVLAYHGLPKAYSASEVAQNYTLETGLKAGDGSYGGLHRRVRVEKTLLPPGIKLNFYAKIVDSDKKAVNGYLHTLDHPLLPPPSIFESLYLFPDFFSTLTSATQGVHGRHYLDWGYDRNASSPGHPKFHGAPLATLFAPSNAAFHLLPPRLKFFLFSPFGERALRAVLAYHYVPHTLLHSEFFYDEKHKSKSVDAQMNIADDPSFHKELQVHSGLPNAILKVEIDKTRVLPIEGAVKVSMKVNGHPVETVDVPARNGAFHVINKLLVPPHHHHDHHGDDLSGNDSWENWEEWLPAWVDSVEE